MPTDFSGPRARMSWRRQLPAYSPLPLRAVLAGAAGLLGGGNAARARVSFILRSHFGAQDVLLVNSGTGALTLAIKACLAGSPGLAGALPAYGCFDLATAADGAGVPVVLYDVDPATLAPDLASLRRALDRGARAVVLAHLYGIPAAPEPVRALCAEAGAWLIEDVAQGAGASLRGRPLGAFGDLAVLSFGRGKGNTGGRGGALLARDERPAALLDSVRRDVLPPRGGFKEYVQLKFQWLFGRPWLYAIPSALPFLRLGETVYHAPSPVRGLSAVAAHTLAVTWLLGGAEADVRRAHAARLLAARGGALVPIALPRDGEPGYLRLPFVASPAARAAAETVQARAMGVMPGYPTALSDLQGFGERVVNGADGFPGAASMAERLVTVPVHGRLAERDVAGLEAWLANSRG